MSLMKVKYQIENLKSAKDDLELSIIKKIIELSEDIKKGRTEPKELGVFAVNTIANLSLENLSDEVSDLLHDSIEFEEMPLIQSLKEIESEAKKLLGRIIAN